MRRAAVLLWLACLPPAACSSLPMLAGCRGTSIVARFEQVGDLVENANVQSSDAVVGRVSDIRLKGWTAEVEMCVDADEEIPGGTRAVVRTTSLLGEKFVDLQTDGARGAALGGGDVIPLSRTSKASELEDVLARLATILGAGNLEQLNRFTSAQAEILGEHAGQLRTVLRKLRDFTGVLAQRKEELAAAIDGLDGVARTLLDDRGVLTEFLETFAESSDVLADQRMQLQDLLTALDRFSSISVQLLAQTERGLDRQFDDLRPVLRTVVARSGDLRATLRTLATFAEWWPESMPGDYLQLDVCQAPPGDYDPGLDCAQADRPAGAHDAAPAHPAPPSGVLELILRRPLGKGAR